jgi:hypothetical protein
MDMAMGKLDSQAEAVAVLDVLSSALRQFDLRTIYPFTQSMVMRLKGRGLTSFVIMERGAHDQSVDAAMEELFDGVIDIMDMGDHLEIAVLSLTDAHFQSEYRLLNKTRDGYSVDVARAGPKKEEVKVVRDMELMARVNRLNHELKLALEEKAELEKRISEFSAREEEMQGRHEELSSRLLEVESTLEERRESADRLRKSDAEHRKELKRLLEHMDELLGELPEHIIDRFAGSEEFKLYEKIITKYREEQGE